MKKRILALALACLMLVSMFPMAIFAAECVHEGGEIVREQKVTCGQNGFTMRACSKCGEEYISDYAAATGNHDYQPMADKPATCTTDKEVGGTKCTVCNKINVAASVVPNTKLGHNWVETLVANEADCTVGSYKVFVCSNCNKTAEEAGKAEGDANKYAAWKKVPVDTPAYAEHSFTKITVLTAPTTCVDGLAEFACANKNCQVKKTAPIAALHDYQDIPHMGKGCSEYVSGKQCTVCGTYKGAVKNNDVEHDNIGSYQTLASVTNAAFKAELIANGYDTDAKMYKQAECYENGYIIKRCSDCGEWWKETTTKSHTLNIVVEGGTKNATYCSTEKAQYIKCTDSDCDYKVKKNVIAAAKTHSFTTKYSDTIDGTYSTTMSAAAKNCGATYYAKDICSCGQAKTPVTKMTAAHSWSAWSAIKGNDCTKGFYQTRTCTSANCTQYKSAYTGTPACTTAGIQEDLRVNVVAVAVANHTMSTGSEVEFWEGDCENESYYAHYCTNANCTKIDSKDDAVEVLAKVPSKHKSPTSLAGADYNNAIVGTAIADKDIKTVVQVNASTCTSEGTLVYICDCGVSRTATLTKVEHDKQEGFKGKATNGTSVDVSAVAPTCAAAGWKAGVACTTCGTITKARATDAKLAGGANKSKHTGTQALVSSANATCISVKTEKYQCSTCLEIYTITSGDTAGHSYVKVDYKDATCIATGNYEYYACSTKGCGKIYDGAIKVDTCCAYEDAGNGKYTVTCSNADVDKQAKHTTIILGNDPTIAAKNHQIKNSTKIANPGYANASSYPNNHFDATCDEKGVTAFTYCDRVGCDMDANKAEAQRYENGKRDIAAHGDAYLVEFKEKDKTCTTDGFGFKGGHTETDLKEREGKHYYCSKCDLNTVVEVKNAGCGNLTSAVYNPASNNDKYECTNATFTYNTCDDCGKITVVATSYVAGKADHNWSYDVYEVKLNADGTTVDDGGNKGYGGPACTTPTFKYQTCVNPNCTAIKKTDEVAASGLHYYYEDNGQTKVKVDLTCAGIAAHDGKVTVCCNRTIDKSLDAGEVNIPADKLGYNHKRVTLDQDATCTEAGVYIDACAWCDKVFSTKNVEFLNAKNPKHDPNAQCLSGYTINFMEEVDATSTTDGYKKYRCPLCNEIVTFVIEAKGLTIKPVVTDKANAFLGGTVTVELQLAAEAYNFNSMRYEFTHNGGFALKSYTNKLVLNDYLVNVSVNENGMKTVVIVTIADKTGAPANYKLTTADKALVAITYDVVATATEAKFTGTAATASALKLKTDKTTEDAGAIEAAYSDDFKNFKTALVGDADGKNGLNVNDSFAIQAAIIGNKNTAIVDFNADGKVDLLDYAAFMKFLSSDMKYVDRLALQNVDLFQLVKDSKIVNIDLDKNGVAGDDGDVNIVLAQVITNLASESYNSTVNINGVIEAAFTAVKP